MNKQIIHGYKGMNQDLSKSLLPNEIYFEGKNIRIIATNSQSTGSVTNEKGNTLIVTIPIPEINSNTSSIDYMVNDNLKSLNYSVINNIQPRNELESQYFISNNNFRLSGPQLIVGHALIRDSLILFTTDNNGFDCIWKVDDQTYDITLLYLRNLGFNTQYPIQTINNYENEIIDKVYWVDGQNQTRFINIHHSTENQDLENLIDLSFNNVQMVGTFEVDQPEIIGTIQGGIHTSGVIQYAYNLYRINGSQTKISPLTELIPLNKGENNGGGALNEVVGTIPIIKIDDLDNTYTNLKLYAVKYTSYNQLPQVSLILDRDISAINEIVYYDDGNIIEDLSIDEFLFLGSDIIIPKHINTKNNIMFFANYKERSFDINTYGEVKDIDTRAYSFPLNTQDTLIYNSLYDNNGVIDSLEPYYNVNASVINGLTIVPYTHSAINKNYNDNKYIFNSNILGGEGSHLRYKIIRNRVNLNSFSEDEIKGKFLKDNEIYRLGIQFYNRYGQNSLPKWIADFKTNTVGNQTNLNGYYASLQIELKPLFYTWLNNPDNFLDDNGVYDESLKPVGYRLLRAERTLLDRTIVCQGLINGMISQVVGDRSGANVTADQITKVNSGLKLPSMMRRFDDDLCPMWRSESYFRLDRLDEYHPQFAGGVIQDAANEVFKAKDHGQWTAGTYQFTKLMQLFSPEITFNTIQNLSQTNLTLIGGLENDYNAVWNQVRSVSSKQIKAEAKTFNAISPHDVKAYLPGNHQTITGGRNGIQFHGFFGHGQTDPDSNPDMNFVQTYRKYTGQYYNRNKVYDIYGVPEAVELGQGRSTYNNDADLVYYNSLEQLSADAILLSVNTWGSRNATFALGSNNILTENRKGLENLFVESTITDTGAGLVGEFRIPENLIYLGNIYGGNTYESKKRSNYIEVGDYNDIDINTYNAIHFGDTFVQDFRFTKLVKTETEIYSAASEQLTEIVEFRVETTVDLSNRNDQSIQNWDNRFQPRSEDYQKYNTVYSQDSNLIIRRDVDYKFRRLNSFDTNVIASKVKIPGEVIDSWTDLQPNNVITLDGKYGPINSLHNFKDELYTLQDTGVAFLSIQPRVQIQGSDGLEVELGSGRVLQEYRYLTTESGTKNKWSVINSPQAFYYFDILNKSINLFKDGIGGLTDAKGLHTYFNNNLIVNELEIDNPILKQGVSTGYDYINNDVFFTFLQNDKNFTLSYNEGSQTFVSFYDYFPSRYISKGNNFITTNPDNNKLYKQYEGEYNNFYGVTYPSNITLLVNPEPNVDTVMDNIMYKSEVYLNNLDQPDKTLTHVRVWNEYQDSLLRQLELGRNKNLRRKFRDWNAILPRQQGSRERIRNPWNFLLLQFNNDENLKLILHNIVVSYTV